MSRKATVESRTAAPAVLVFGCDGDGALCAAWFTGRDAARLPAAPLARCQVVPLADADHRALPAGLARGRIRPNGSAAIPRVRRELHDELVQAFPAEPQPPTDLIADCGHAATNTTPVVAEDGAAHESSGDGQPDETGTPGPGPASATPTATAFAVGTPVAVGRPRDWEEIRIGSVVLAYDPSSEGWYEAIVFRQQGDQFQLRWREYPAERTVARTREQLALLYPDQA